MKKIFTLCLFAAIYASQVMGQGFSINPRTVVTGGFADSTQGLIEISSTFTNTSTDPADNSFTWTIITLNKPNKWDLSICDPQNCYGSMKLYDSNTFNLAVGQNGLLKFDFSRSNNAGMISAKVVFKSNKTQNKDTFSVDLKGWGTGVKEISKAKELSFYPNPAKDNMVLKYNSKEPLQVDIYNVLGMKIKSVIHTNNETNIDLSDIQNGVYFIRFKDDGRTISKSFTKAE